MIHPIEQINGYLKVGYSLLQMSLSKSSRHRSVLIRDSIDEILMLENSLLHSLLNLAGSHTNTVMPGFTHLQVAQPITFGHHIMAWFEMLLRDRDRLIDCRKRTNILPLGSAALAGTSFKPDRKLVAERLGFDDVTRNSLDAVSDRDFLMEFSACVAITMIHFSRWCEEIVLWSSQQFNFIDLPDAFCTGSSTVSYTHLTLPTTPYV